MKTIHQAKLEYETRYPDHAQDLLNAKSDRALIEIEINLLIKERMDLIREIRNETA